MSIESTFTLLQMLERELHGPAVRRDQRRLAELLHPAFHEFGRSGATYTRESILERLVAEPVMTHVHAQDFLARELAPSIVLLTYRSAHVSGSGELEHHTNRSSIWRLEPAGWQMVFHQGTPTEVFAKKMQTNELQSAALGAPRSAD